MHRAGGAQGRVGGLGVARARYETSVRTTHDANPLSSKLSPGSKVSCNRFDKRGGRELDFYLQSC